MSTLVDRLRVVQPPTNRSPAPTTMGRAIGFAATLIVFAVLLPDVFAALKILLLKVVTLSSMTVDAMASASFTLQ